MVLALFVLALILFVVLPIIGVTLWLLITTAVLGLFFGMLGRLVVPGRQPMGVLATIAVGWLGSLIGLAIGRGARLHSLPIFLLEVGGSALLVVLWSVTVGRTPIGGGGRRSISRGI